MTRRSVLKRVLIMALLIVAVLVSAGLARHRAWSDGLLADLAAKSLVAETARGPVEYALVGNDGDPVVLAIHGTPGGYDQILEDAHHLTKRGFRVLTLSRPGYLRTPLVGNESFEAQADLIAALLDSLGIDRVFVNAGSGGGPMAIFFAAGQPERCLGLVLISAISKKIEFNDPWWTSDLVHFIFFSGPVYDGLNLMARADPTAMLPAERTHGETGDGGLGPDGIARLQRVIDSTLPLAGRNVGMQNDFRQFAAIIEFPLSAIRAPALIIHGAADQTVPPDHATHATEQIPNATLHMVENGSHLLFLEQTEVIHAEGARFMREVLAGRDPPKGATPPE